MLSQQRRAAKRGDGLPVELETVVLKRIENARTPFDLVTAQGQLAVRGMVEVDAIAAAVLGDAARGVAHGQEFIDILAGERHHADTDADRKRPLMPRETQRLRRLAQAFRRRARRIRRRTLVQHAKLVAAQARQQIVG